MQISFGSSVHGAGRVMPRHKAIHTISGKEIKKQLEAKGECTHPDVLAEEADAAYKPIDEAIESVHMAGISMKFVRMVPLGVLKGYYRDRKG